MKPRPEPRASADGTFTWHPTEAARMLERGQGHKMWISLKDLANLCDEEGVARDRIKPALSAGVLIAQGKSMADGKGYTDIEVRLDTVVTFLALELIRE